MSGTALVTRKEKGYKKVRKIKSLPLRSSQDRWGGQNSTETSGIPNGVRTGRKLVTNSVWAN